MVHGTGQEGGDCVSMLKQAYAARDGNGKKSWKELGGKDMRTAVGADDLVMTQYNRRASITRLPPKTEITWLYIQIGKVCNEKLIIYCWHVSLCQMPTTQMRLAAGLSQIWYSTVHIRKDQKKEG